MFMNGQMISMVVFFYFIFCSGMRTHIRMHFDKKSSDFNEEHYISCILEEDGMELPPPTATPAAAAAAAATSTVAATAGAATSVNCETGSAQLHSCDKCNYSSSYKGNVVSLFGTQKKSFTNALFG